MAHLFLQFIMPTNYVPCCYSLSTFPQEKENATECRSFTGYMLASLLSSIYTSIRSHQNRILGSSLPRALLEQNTTNHLVFS